MSREDDFERRSEWIIRWLCYLAGIVLGGIAAGLGGWNPLVDRGVRAHARGEYVVVPLPDGTDVVVKAKRDEQP